ncbi:hypothetical protein GEMRC1_001082 [Eukaryota sp. GEM-RC1]
MSHTSSFESSIRDARYCQSVTLVLKSLVHKDPVLIRNLLISSSDFINSDSSLSQNQLLVLLRYIVELLDTLISTKSDDCLSTIGNTVLKYLNLSSSAVQKQLSHIITTLLTHLHSFRVFFLEHYTKNKYLVSPYYFSDFFSSQPADFIVLLTELVPVVQCDLTKTKLAQSVTKDLLFLFLIQLNKHFHSLEFLLRRIPFEIVSQFVLSFALHSIYPSDSCFFLLLVVSILIHYYEPSETLSSLVFGLFDKISKDFRQTSEDQSSQTSFPEELEWFVYFLKSRFDSKEFNDVYNSLNLETSNQKDFEKGPEPSLMIIQEMISDIQHSLCHLYSQNETSLVFAHLITSSPILPGSRDKFQLRRQNMVLKGQMLALELELYRSKMVRVPKSICEQEIQVDGEMEEVEEEKRKTSPVFCHNCIMSNKNAQSNNRQNQIINCQEIKIKELEAHIALLKDQISTDHVTMAEIKAWHLDTKLPSFEEDEEKKRYTKDEVTEFLGTRMKQFKDETKERISEKDELIRQLYSNLNYYMEENKVLSAALNISKLPKMTK